MDRERVKELLPILEAFAEGKAIQRRWKGDRIWQDVTESDWLAEEYRVKPEPREFWLDLTERQFIEYGKGSRYWGAENELIRVREVLSDDD